MSARLSTKQVRRAIVDEFEVLELNFRRELVEKATDGLAISHGIKAGELDTNELREKFKGRVSGEVRSLFDHLDAVMNAWEQ